MKVKDLIKGLEGMDDDGIVEIEIYPPDGGETIFWDFEIDRAPVNINENALLRLKSEDY